MAYQADAAVFVPVIPSFKDFRRALSSGLDDPQVSSLAGKSIEAMFGRGARSADLHKVGRDAGLALVRAVDTTTQEEARRSSPLAAFGREAGKEGAHAGKAFGDGFFRDSAGRLREANGKFATINSQFTKSGESAGSHFARGFGARVKGSGGHGGGGGGGLGGGLVGLASKAAAPLAALFAVGQATDILKDSVARASDLNEAGTKTVAIFGKDGAKALDDFSKGSAQALGQTKLQILDAAGTFGTFGKAAGLAGPDLVKFSTGLNGLSTDLASFFNVDPKQAVDDLAAGLRGEAEPLRKYGILLNDASLKAEGMSLGLVKASKNQGAIKIAQQSAVIAQRKYNDAVKQHGKNSDQALSADNRRQRALAALSKATTGSIQPLTAQQKILAAQSLIYKQTKDAQGDFSRTSSGLANQQRILSAQWAEAKTRLGTALLPAVNQVIRAFNRYFQPAVDAVARAFRKASPVFREIGGVLSRVFGSLTHQGPQASGFITKQLVPAFGGVVAASRKLGAVVLPIIKQIVARFVQDWPKIKPVVVSVFKIVGSIVKDVMGFVSTYISHVTAVVSYIWSRWGKQISAFTSGTFKSIVLSIKSAMEIVSGIVKVLTGVMTGNWSKAGEGIKKIVKGLAGALLATFGLSTDDISRAVKRLWDGLKRSYQDGVTAVGRIWDQIKDNAKQPIRFVVQTVLEDGILAAVRTISGAVGFDAGKNLHVSLPAGFHDGGWTGPGAKMQPAGVVHADEFVINKASRGKIERDAPGLLNRLNGYAGGGLVGGAGSWTPRFESILRHASQIFGSDFSIYQRGFRPATSYSGTSHAGDAVDLGPVSAIVVKILRSLGVAAWRRGPGFPGGFPFGHIHGVPLPGYGSAGGQGVWQGQDYLHGGDGLGGRDYEARGGKVGILGKIGAFIKSGFNSVGDWFKSLVSGPMKKLSQIGNTPLGQMAGKLPGMAVEGLASKFKLFDQGGMLPPGLTMAMNGTGRPERILTDQQWQHMARPGQRLAPLASYEGAHFYAFPADFFAQQQQQMERVATMHGRWDG